MQISFINNKIFFLTFVSKGHSEALSYFKGSWAQVTYLTRFFKPLPICTVNDIDLKKRNDRKSYSSQKTLFHSSMCLSELNLLIMLLSTKILAIICSKC